MHLGCGPRYDDPEAYTLGIPTAAPGTYKLCWSAEQTVEVGDFTLLGPEPASVSCTLGRDCDLELTAPAGLSLGTTHELRVYNGSCGEPEENWENNPITATEGSSDEFLIHAVKYIQAPQPTPF